MPMKRRPRRLAAGGADAEEGVHDHVPGLGRGEDHPMQQRLGLLGRMRLDAGGVLDPLVS
jgi:hypothetical protein